MGYTLIAARVSQLPIWVFTLTVTLWGLPKRRRLVTLDARSQPIMGHTPTAAQVGRPPILVFTLTATL